MTIISLFMQNLEIEKEEKAFLKSLHELQSDINKFFYDISIGEDYDDESANRLFKVFKFLKGVGK